MPAPLRTFRTSAVQLPVIFAAEAVKHEAAIDVAIANDRIYEIIFFINSFTSEDIGNTAARHAYV